MDINDLLFQAIKDGIKRIVVAGVIINNDKVLILKRKSDDFMPGIYEIPGGVANSGKLYDELKREIKEETGNANFVIDKYIGHFDYLSKSGKKTRQLNYKLITNNQDVTLTEHETYAWASKNELSDYNISIETKTIITEVFEC